MARPIRRNGTSSGSSNGVSRTLATIGSDGNHLMSDMPCLVPKENVKFLTHMQKQANISSFGDYPNPYNGWKSGK